MHFVLLSLITNPVLTAASAICVTAASAICVTAASAICVTAASAICVTTYSIALPDRPSASTSSVLAIYSLVLFRIVPFGLVSLFLITFSSAILNSAVDSPSSYLKPFPTPNVIVNFPWIYTFPFESCNVIFIT
jgi:hypothetical protein